MIQKKLFMVAVLITLFTNLFAQTLNSEEQKLYKLIMNYRTEKGLPKIPLSKSLTFVAQTHVRDLCNNKPDVDSCNMHSWSNKGNWNGCCYTDDHAQAKFIWNKPRELTSYKGSGYEIAYYSMAGANAVEALEGWINSSEGHRKLIINEAGWKSHHWQAIGIGIYKYYAVVWFGEEEDEDKK